jgi:hypothetical protein
MRISIGVKGYVNGRRLEWFFDESPGASYCKNG